MAKRGIILALICMAGVALGQEFLTPFDASLLQHLTIRGPTDYLHFWNPASLDETDQGPGGNDADSIDFNPDSTNGWNIGTNDNNYVLLDGPITNGTSYTVTAWIKPDITAMNTNAYGGWIVCDRTASGATRDFQLFYSSISFAYIMSVINSAGTIQTDNNSNVLNNVWQHLAVVVDSDAETIEVFVNGTSDGSTALTITPNDNYTGRAKIGAAASWDASSTATKYHGSIDKVRFYQRALSQDEILAEIKSDGNTGP
jgi:hypothetical protein